MVGPKGKDRLPTIDFQGRTVSFREGSFFQGFSDGNSEWNFSWENQMKVIHSQFALWQFNPTAAAEAKPGDKCKDSNTARNREARAQPTNSMVRCRDWLRKDLFDGAGVIYGWVTTLEYFNGWFTYKSSHEKKGKWSKQNLREIMFHVDLQGWGIEK